MACLPLLIVPRISALDLSWTATGRFAGLIPVSLAVGPSPDPVSP